VASHQPIPVRVVGASPTASPTAWVAGGQLLINDGETFESEQFFIVPLGQRLVVEAISIDAFMPLGQIAIQATFLASTDGGVTFRFPLPSLPSDVAGRDHFGTVLSTKLNVGAGNGVILLSVRRNASTGTGLVNVALSGYLVEDDH
jgi:hypothetical protein